MAKILNLIMHKSFSSFYFQNFAGMHKTPFSLNTYKSLHIYFESYDFMVFISN